ncbi:MAG: hypothetical protein Q8J76_07840 [Desulfobulbaceae bacterium]|nr:hypothetical protein [Desulfobulbaceae bacterium]
MNTTISYTKDTAQHNILFDEYFSEHATIEVVAFNYNGTGAALCQCDGALMEIQSGNLHKIIFGTDKEALETYLTGIFDPETESDEILRKNDTPVFRLPELQQMKKYDSANLAKKTLQEVKELPDGPFHYFVKND